MTPTQIELHNAHKARLQRIAQAAARINPKTDSEFSAALNDVPVQDVTEPKNKEPWFYDPKASSLIPDKPAAVSISDIQKAACCHFGISLNDLRKTRRLHAVVRPRQIAMYLCRELTVRSFPEIGRMFGGWDHTTVLHSGRVIEKLIKSDWRIAYDVAHIEGLLS